MNGLEAELNSLRSRKTNLPRKNLSVRHTLCEAAGLPEADLPYAGELLRVRESETAWEGAVERLLHGFGLSLLVPGHHYARVAAYVDATHLTGRLVYFKTSAGEKGPVAVPGPNALLRNWKSSRTHRSTTGWKES